MSSTKKQFAPKPFKELNLLDRFLFDSVMEDKQVCRDVLSICIGIDIPPIKDIQCEKVFELSSNLRAVRLDVFSFDEKDTAYNTEMQKVDTKKLRKRSRYYQAHLDV